MKGVNEIIYAAENCIVLTMDDIQRWLIDNSRNYMHLTVNPKISLYPTLRNPSDLKFILLYEDFFDLLYLWNREKEYKTLIDLYFSSNKQDKLKWFQKIEKNYEIELVRFIIEYFDHEDEPDNLLLCLKNLKVKDLKINKSDFRVLISLTELYFI